MANGQDPDAPFGVLDYDAFGAEAAQFPYAPKYEPESIFPQRPLRSEVVAASPMHRRERPGVFSDPQHKRDWELQKLNERKAQLAQLGGDPAVLRQLGNLEAQEAELNQADESEYAVGDALAANERRRKEIANEAYQRIQALPDGISRKDRAAMEAEIRGEADAQIEEEGVARPADEVEKAIAYATGGDPHKQEVEENATYLNGQKEEAGPGKGRARGKRAGPRTTAMSPFEAIAEQQQAAAQGAIDAYGQIQADRAAEVAEEDARLDAFAQRSRQADEEMKEKLAELDREEERMQFLADHPNANEAELSRAYAVLNDPDADPARKEKVRSALERTKELNPYRMVNTPGGMLAAVASIVAAGIGGAKNPAEQLEKAMAHDLNLQKQRQERRRGMVLRTAKKRGREQEAREALRRTEDFENRVQLQRYSNAMGMFQDRTQDAKAIAGFEAAKVNALGQLEQMRYQHKQKLIDRNIQQNAMNQQMLEKYLERQQHPLAQMGFKIEAGYDEKYGADARRLAGTYKNLPMAYDTIKRLGGVRLNPYSTEAKDLAKAKRQVAVAIALENQGGSGILRDAEVDAEEKKMGSLTGLNASANVNSLMNTKSETLKKVENRLGTFGVVPLGGNFQAQQLGLKQ